MNVVPAVLVDELSPFSTVADDGMLDSLVYPLGSMVILEAVADDGIV